MPTRTKLKNAGQPEVVITPVLAGECHITAVDGQPGLSIKVTPVSVFPERHRGRFADVGLDIADSSHGSQNGRPEGPVLGFKVKKRNSR